jgi:2-hydroxychromene-2-carboxylate isomerase
MRMKPIDFWYSIGSTYTCLTVFRLAEVTAQSGATFVWRPFDVRSIMVAQNNIPFRDKPVKAAYMWRDIDRRAALYGLRLRLPAPYPLERLDFANRIAVLGATEGWCAAYTRAAYRLWFQEGLPAGSEPNVSRSLTEIGQDPGRVLPLVESPAIRDALARETAEAATLGVFGAPSFVVEGEVFWGDDRLEDAIAWARSGQLGS